MAWTVSVTLDADKTNVGTASAMWDADGDDEFTYSRRARVTDAEGDAFVAEAVAARDARAVRRERETELAAILQSKFDALP